MAEMDVLSKPLIYEDGLKEKGVDNKLLHMLPEDLHKYIVQPDCDLQKVYSSQTTGLGLGGSICCASVILAPYVYSKMMLVEKGCIGLTQHGDSPVIYGPGRYYLLSPSESCHRIVALTQNAVIKHGSYHIIAVKLGEMGIGIDMASGLPKILATGTHVIDSPTFVFHKFTQLTDAVTDIGQLKLVRVEIGFIGYGYTSSGDLMILDPGLHLICPPDRYVDNLSMQVQIIQLPAEVHESKDYVQISVRAAVYYTVSDPHKALTTVGKKMNVQIKELAVAALQQIIRSSRLVEIAGTSKVSHSEKKKSDIPLDTEGMGEGENDFYTQIHDHFMSALHDHVYKDWGIDISNIRIESLRINDKKLAASIANQAIQVSELEAKHMMLEKQTNIITVQAQNKARELEITTSAKANAAKLMAESNAEAAIIEARGAKEAKILRGQGDAEYSELVKGSGLGAELAKLEIYAKAMQKMNQVCYVPHLPAMLGKANPMMDSSMLMPDTKRRAQV